MVFYILYIFLVNLPFTVPLLGYKSQPGIGGDGRTLNAPYNVVVALGQGTRPLSAQR
jgi:hypothetical protein